LKKEHDWVAMAKDPSMCFLQEMEELQITAKGASDCTERFPGSSGPAALASGIIALVLQANPDLAWRDIQHLIARSSKPLHPPISSHCRRCERPSWRNNAANLTGKFELAMCL